MTVSQDKRLHFYGSIASIAGVVSALATFWFTQASASRGLSVRVLSEELLLTEPLKGELKLLYKEEAIDNVVTFLVEIRNTGRRPIKPEDFEGPVEFEVTNVESVILVTELYTEPAELSFIPSTEISGAKVAFGPLLLNPKDMALLAVKATLIYPYDPETFPYDPEIKISKMRIAGIRGVSLQAEQQRRSVPESYLIALLVGMAASFLVGMLSRANKGASPK